MYTSVRHDICYDFQSRVINVKNKDKTFSSSFLAAPFEALRFTSRVLRQLHNPYKFLADSSFGSNFRDLKKFA